nr:MAG TPA: hypothetical protein [Caudoviricetes sp.]
MRFSSVLDVKIPNLIYSLHLWFYFTENRQVRGE